MKITKRQDKALRELVLRIARKAGKSAVDTQRHLAPMRDAELVSGAVLAMFCCGYSPARAAAMIGSLGLKPQILAQVMHDVGKVLNGPPD